MDELRTLSSGLLPLIVIVFMTANLASIGLEVDPSRIVAPLRDRNFVSLALLWDWLLCPGIALLLAAVVPMARPYALGLELIGLAPAAPFLPVMVRKAGGDLAYAAAFMLTAAVGTVILMPIVLPMLVPGVAVSTWTVARPLIAFVLAPLGVGLVIRTAAPTLGGKLAVLARALARAATLVLLVMIVILYFEGFIGAIGSYAIGTQLLFTVAIAVGAYASGARLEPEKRSVLCLGVCTRNLGAALAPVLAVSSDLRTTVMVALGVPINLIVTFAMARWLAARSPTKEP
ncbi:MAG: hypothetical protein JSR90_03775 [Proteobacteria bacterium]|nr:hypothetical protein [Pseudomonadota bacterium]